MKTEEREQARRLRREEGRSVRDIALTLRVSRSSASLWVRDIPLTEAQRDALEQRNRLYGRQARGAQANAARGRERRRQYQGRGRALARRGDSLHAAGCMLYWAEGKKARNVVVLSNSDPQVVRFFLEFLRTYFDVPDDRVRVGCNLFADHEERRREIEQFWLDFLELPRTCLTPSTVNKYSRYARRNAGTSCRTARAG